MSVRLIQGFPGGSDGKESACSVEDLGLIPRLGRSPGEGNSYPLQYSGLEHSMDHIVHGVSKSRTWLRDFDFWLIQECEAYLETGLLKSGHITVVHFCQSPTYEPSSCELLKIGMCYYPDITAPFFKRVDRIESSKEPEPVPSASDVGAMAACPPSPTADDPSTLPSPTSSPCSSQEPCLFTWCQHLYANCCTVPCTFQDTVL